MSDKKSQKPLSVRQGCSKWVNKFAEDFLMDKEYNHQTLRWASYNYIRLVDWFPNDNVEDIVIDMFKTNYTVLGYFDGDKEKVQEEITDLFRNNNCINEFVDDMKLFVKDVVEPLGQNKHEIFISQTRNELAYFDKVDKVYNTGVLDWNFVKKQFQSNMEFWKVKEAIAWMVGFVENCDYELSELLVMGQDNRVNKWKTFDNLIEKINEASLTQNNPFVKKNGKLYFNDAKAGEVDVMLWNERKKKVVAMSATRDRGFKVEGNQFPRHYIKSMVLYDNIIDYYNKAKLKLSPEDAPKILRAKNVQKLVRSEGFKRANNYEKANLISVSPSVKDEIQNLNVFAKDLSFLRENIKNKLGIDFHKNGLNITDKELSSILAYSESKLDFVFFGELQENKHMPTVQAGLNCLAYRDNFKRLGKFRMTDNASNIFMRSIGKRFNGISVAEKNVDSYGQDFIIDLIKNHDNKNDVLKNIQYFSEGNVYADDRACLFKSCSVLFRNIITELDRTDTKLRSDSYEIGDKTKSDITNESIERGIRFFFDQGIDKNDLKMLKDFFSDTDKMDSFILNFDSIKTAVSEVPLELEELEFCKERVVASFNNVEDRVEIAELKAFKESLKNKQSTKNEEKEDISEKKVEKKKRTFYKRKKSQP